MYWFATVLIINCLSCQDGSFTTTIHVSTRKQDDAFKNQIDNIKEFSNSFLRQYRKLIKEKVGSAFVDSFPLTHEPFTINAIISSYSESVISFQNSSAFQLNIYCTDLSAQLKLMIGREMPDDTIYVEDKNHPYSDNIDSINAYYKSAPALSGYIGGGSYPDRCTYSSNTATIWKIFKTIPGTTNLIINGYSLTSAVTQLPVFSKSEEIAVLLGDNYFKNLDSTIAIASSLIFQYYAEALVHRSELFCKAVSYPDLSSKARKIAEKIISSESLSAENYPPYEFEMDVINLHKAATEEGIIDSSYPMILINTEIKHTIAGKLFWSYWSHIGFSIQWCIINFVLLIIIVVITKIRLVKINIKILLGIIDSTVLFVNGYFFYQKPKNIDLYYLLIPLLLLGVIAYFSQTKLKSHNK
jgi:hypothetical protein